MMNYILLVTIETVGECMAIFPKSVNNELSTFFVESYTECEEIKEALEKLKKELEDLVYYFNDLMTTFFFLPDRYRKYFDFITENEKFQENIDRMKQCFVEDFLKQLEIMQKSKIYETDKNFCKKIINNQ